MITSFFAPKKTGSTAGSSIMDSSSKRNREELAESTSKAKKKRPAPDANDDEVQELLAYLTVDDKDGPSSWKDALDRYTSRHSFASLAKFLAKERLSNTVFPPATDTFSAFMLTPLDSVKVVIVGQDPYHGVDQAHGLCFSVRKGVKVPPSLKNIYKELSNDPNVDFPSGKENMPKHGNLERWAKQGVLLLNAVLTVRKGEAFSHRKRGWEAFTDEVIRVVDHYATEKGRGLVFLLWGKPASEKATSILSRGNKSKLHTVIQTSHPSPLGATKTASPFLGSKCFSRANAALVERGVEPIDWNVDGV